MDRRYEENGEENLGDFDGHQDLEEIKWFSHFRVRFLVQMLYT